MDIKVEILKDVSFDPVFKVKFSCKTQEKEIKNALAEVIRKPPKPQINFETNTIDQLDLTQKQKLEMEILNKVIEYLFSNGVSVGSSSRAIHSSSDKK